MGRSPKYAARVDANQAAIVSALRLAGASVQPLHAVGKGCPDLLVGWKGQNYLLECKDDSKPPSARQLTLDQQAWHRRWHGQKCVVENVEEALAVILEK